MCRTNVEIICEYLYTIIQICYFSKRLFFSALYIWYTFGHKKTLSLERAAVTPGGLEPPTDRTGICYSIH